MNSKTVKAIPFVVEMVHTHCSDQDESVEHQRYAHHQRWTVELLYFVPIVLDGKTGKSVLSAIVGELRLQPKANHSLLAEHLEPSVVKESSSHATRERSEHRRALVQLA